MSNSAQRYLFLDCETIPDLLLPESLIPKFKPKANTKNPDLIAKQEEKFKEDLVKKMSTDTNLAQIICFSGQHIIVEPNGKIEKEEPFSFFDPDSDVEIVKKIQKEFDKVFCLVGCNTKVFDIPLIFKRSAVHNVLSINLASNYPAYTSKYNNMKSIDLTSYWDMSQNYTSVNSVAIRLGLKPKINSGSAVFNMWKDKKFDDIIEYCEDDVRINFEIWERICPQYRFESPKHEID